MKDNTLKDQIKAVLEEAHANAMSYNEMVVALKLNKREKAILPESLNAMLSEGVVEKNKRKFRLLKPSPIKEQSPATSSPKLIEGIFDATPLSRNYSYAFVRTETGDFFISSEDILNAYHNDKVMIEPHYKKGKSDYARIRRVISRANENLAGDIREHQNRKLFICSNPKIHNWFEVLDVGAAKDGDKVILNVSNWGNPVSGKMPAGKVTEVLGLSGDPQVELLAVLRQYDLPMEFPEPVICEVNLIPEEISAEMISHRKDLRKLYTFTIDPASAKDFDDAISLEKHDSGWTLYVHIADVAHYVGLDSLTFAESAKRGNSFYFPKKVIPMLPERLSNKICSLRPDEDKLCLTVITDFDQKAKVKNQSLHESVIRSDARLSYEEVDDLFDGKSTIMDEALTSRLHESRTLSKLLSEKRLASGYIMFDLPEIEYHYDEEGFVHRLGLSEETDSHKLIENFMLVANEFVAEKLTQQSPHSMYRIHEDPDLTKIERVIETLSYYGISFYMKETLNLSMQYLLRSMPSPEFHKVFDRIVLRSMKKAKYSTEHVRHFGLGMETYTHFTSPIRRLCDLVIHHLCKSYICKSGKHKISTNQLKLWANTASERELIADQAERDIERIYYLAYMKSHVGEKFKGLVIATNSSSLIVRLDEIPVSAVLKVAKLRGGGWTYYDKEMRFVNGRTGEYYQLTDRVKVQVVDVSDDIYLELSQDKDAHTHLFEKSEPKTKPKDTKELEKRRHNRSRNAVDANRQSKKSGNQASRKQSNKRKK
ncbi:MAG: VacB/RNase II family 3'-5' exoribonuclease [Candidatus Cloacimonadaceae bacterium]|nr:VacB/RNase II family 3'-5' exoribonuclease [Candidatus Cloacimonadaceae bacterium]MDP3114647.1 VacB/RNase II family 3'-5' exoribonuclease [Candidatus Cloacimonadaceae bacterium]